MTEIAARASFERLRYAQLWEDADILLEALDIRPGDRCVSIAAAGDNAVAMLTRDPASVLAVDLSPAQLASTALRAAALRHLPREDWLRLAGSRPATPAERAALYARCRPALPPEAAAYWDAHPQAIAGGVAGSGKFEHFFSIFRRRVMPLIHRRATVERLLRGDPDPARRTEFYDKTWDNRRWRLLFRIFFSRTLMGRLGRDPEFFRYVEGDVATRILERTRHALTALDPADNPYLNWILSGTHAGALPLPWRDDAYEAAAARVDRLEWRQCSLEEALATLPPRSVHRFNLSDIFEYMSPAGHEAALRAILRVAAPGARLVYWNMLVPRSRPGCLADRLRPLDDLAHALHARDKAFFYSALRIEEVVG